MARRVGPQRALQWCLAGEPVGAEAALAAGLATRLLDADQWDPALLALAACPPVATAALKANLYAAAGRDLAAGVDAERQAQAACWESEECAEGLAAFGRGRRA